MKKRIIAAWMTMVMSVGTVGLTGCGKADSYSMATSDNASTTASVSETAEAPTNVDASYSSESYSDESGEDYYDGYWNGYEDSATASYSNSVRGVYDAAMDTIEYEGGWWEPSGDEWDREEYSHYEENAWMSVNAAPFSTFGVDVDTASYANIRRMLLDRDQIPADAVRIEEMINYFSYDYPEPKSDQPFSVTTEIAPCPWNDDTELLLVGLKARKMDMRERVDSNLVFLIDVSGSMSDNDKLPLIQRSFRLLCEELGPNDRVSLVTYASEDKVVLEGVSGKRKSRINDAMEDLYASGGTNGSAGLLTAYELAEDYFIEGGNNRVILATDGDLNIGLTDEDSLKKLIEEKAKSGVYLSVLGFGTGNISDTNMEALADHGNGNYSYIDSIAEAKKVLIEEMGGTLFPVAKDVKLQVEFNPAYIKGYRLIGYENRTMAARDFADDTKDGGEIGAGHTVTALYEIAKVDSRQDIPEITSRYTRSEKKGLDWLSDKEYLTVNIRYKEPDGDTSKEIVCPVDSSSESRRMSENLSWAAGVAQIGMILKNSEYAGDTQLENVLKRMERLKSVEEDDYREEFIYLFSRYMR